MKRPGGALPPRLPALLLRIVLPKNTRGLSIRGDLLEEFRQRVRESGRGPANRWYWVNTVGVVFLHYARGFRHRPSRPRTVRRSRSKEIPQSALQDLRFAVRMIAKRPLPNIVIVLTLGLGIGVNVMFFAGFSGMVIRPLPFAEPDRLVTLTETQPRIGATQQSVSPLNYRDWNEQNGVFERISAYDYRNVNVRSGDNPERVDGSGVSADLFPLLGLDPVVGRHFTSAEDRPGGAPVALISYDVWERQFQFDPGVVGKTVRLDDRPHEIVGVMPPGVHFPHFANVWVPLSLDYENIPRSTRWLQTVARLAPSVSVSAAQAEMNEIARRLEEFYPETNEGRGVRVRSMREDWLPPSSQMGSFAQQVSVSFVLLIVCANIANLVLAQGSARRQEIAIRASLGAGRGRLLRQFLIESLVLAAAGGTLGTALGYYGGEWTKANVAVPIPYWVDLDFDIGVLAYAATITVATALVFGVIPALRHTRADRFDALRSGMRTDNIGGGRLRAGLVITQLAFSMMLVVGSSLVVRGLIRLNQIERGHDVEHVLTLRLSLAGERYRDGSTRAAFVHDLVGRVADLPDVVDAGIANSLPASNNVRYSVRIRAEGEVLEANEEHLATYHTITPTYLHALDVSVEAGRMFTSTEGREVAQGDGVAIVNQTLADELWPGQDPVGRRLRLTAVDSPSWRTIIGVVPDLEPAYQIGGIDRPPRAQLYVPYGSDPHTIVVLVVRGTGDPERLVAPVRAEVRRADRSVPVFDVFTMKQVLTQTHWVPRIISQQFALFGAIALLIALVGTYSVTAYSVSQRTREMGIRMALGAAPTAVLALVVRQGAKLGVVGAALGIALAIPMAVFLGSVFQDVEAKDPPVFIGVGVLLLASAVVASYLAARRAARIDPVVALSAE